MKHIINFLFIVLAVQVSAQLVCASHIQLENQINSAPNPQFVLNEIASLKTSNFIMTKAGNTITIPVVFHIIHNGDAIGTNENISEQTILDQIERMNEDFAGLNADSALIPNEFKPFFARSEIQFCLARKDPQGNFTLGINRYLYSEPAYDLDSINDFIKPATIWNRNEYLNIWSIAFTGFLGMNQVNGYATPPLTSTADSIDGIVLRYDKIGNDISNNIGRTATHEIGHWLGLFHIWGDDNGACTGDDGIADTPNQADEYFNCPVTPNSCGNNDMYVNYMDYTDAECSLMFTADQKTRMHSVLNGFRDSIQLSEACQVKDLVITEIISPSGTICQEDVLGVLKLKNIGNIGINQYEVEMYVDNILNETIAFNSLIEANEETYIQFESSYNFPANISHEVKFVINSLESNEYNLNNTDSVIFNTVNTGSGLAEVNMSDFEGASFPPQFIFIENPDNDITWQYYDLNGDQVFFIDNFNNTLGRIDAFTTTDYTMNSGFYLTQAINFSYEYRQKNNLTDTLNVYYSIDCGANWIPINSYSGTSFGDNENSSFFPSSIANSISINFQDFLPNLQFKKIRFKFENISGGGNNLFIGNLRFDVISGIQEIKEENFKVYPNPSQDFIIVESEQNTSTKLSITDAIGNKVFQQNIEGNKIEISTQEMNSGLYFLRFENQQNQSFFFKKIIINH